jgi:hypothetical protein
MALLYEILYRKHAHFARQFMGTTSATGFSPAASFMALVAVP